MRQRLLTIVVMLFVSCNLAFAAATPDWVTRKPTTAGKYVGISRVAISDSNYREKATQQALADIAAQVSSKVSSSSFMRSIDVDGKASELFERKISQSVAEHLEGQRLVDSYQDASHYYAYYELDIKQYERAVEARRSRAVNDGFDMYVKGRAAESSNNLPSAASLYAQGLELVEPYLYMSLTMDYNGREIDVANELYNAFINIYSGTALVPNTTTLAGEAFKSISEPIVVCLSRKGVVIPNMKLKAQFTSGSGAITPASSTNYEGTATFYVSNITSKEPVQTVEISMDDSVLDRLPDSYRSLMSSDDWATTTITIALTSSNYTAYFNVENNDIESCESHVRGVLTNNYFELTDSADADLYISYSTDFEVGDVIAGEISDFNECFCSMTIKIFDNKSKQQLLEYSIPKSRVLVATNKSVPQAMQSCARSLIVQCKKELPMALKKLNLNR